MQNSTLPATAGVEKKLLVAFGPCHVAGPHSKSLKSSFTGDANHSFHGFLVQRCVADDAALSHLALLKLELRLNQDQKICAGSCQWRNGRQHLCRGDE